jgi:hypothetical protein
VIRVFGAMLIFLLLTTVAWAQSPLELWKANMLSYGQMYCENGDHYYDAVRVYYQIAEYTGNPQWERCAEIYNKVYRDDYLVPGNYGAQGWQIFPHGLMMHYQRTRDEKSRAAVIGLALNASYAYAPLEWTAPTTKSREVAYNLEAKLIAEKFGYNNTKRMEQLADQALGHYHQWFVSKTAPYVQPFMVALSAEALIMWYDKTKDPRVLPALKTGADWMWQHMWLPNEGAFKYTDRKIEGGDEHPAHDLNLLVVPLYGWVYKMTGDVKYREMGDKIFQGGVNAYLGRPKHFNQQYRWSFNYVLWRETAPR